ncbi:MAG TPA: phage holin family protein [Rugosimonospora sp.]|nr:phage holin family protein [Rugosimonospora sp.]
MRFVIRLLISAVALWVTTLVVTGVTIHTDSTIKKIGTLLAVALIFGLVNAVLKPIAHGIGCGVYVLTLGLLALVVNGFLFWLTGKIATHLGLPFEVHGVWSSILGALIVGVVSWLLGVIIPEPKKG